MTKKFAFIKWEGMFEGELPLSKQLKPNELLVLQILALTQGAGGYSDITQKQMLECLPIGSNKTLQTAIDGLVAFRLPSGEPIIEKSKKKGMNGREQNVYKLLPNPLWGVYGEKPMEDDESCVNSTVDSNQSTVNSTHTKEEKITKEKELNNTEECSMRELKNKDIITVFCDTYQKVNQTEYQRNFKMDNKFTTIFLKSIDADFKNNEIKRIVEIVVENYGKWSTNTAKYPLTIRTLTYDWIVEKAKVEMKKEKESLSQVVEQSVEATKVTQKSVSSIMDRIKKKQGGSN